MKTAKDVKVVAIGAGSSSFGRGIIADLMGRKDLNEQANLKVVLVDTDEVALDRMYRLGRRLREYHAASAELEMTTDRCEALPGADFVITSVALDRNARWRDDQLMAFAYGFKAPYSENGGPAAAFHTLRGMHLMVPIARDIEKLCPGALLLNFTNPESRICLAVSKLTKVKAVGLCHGAVSTLKTACEIIGLPEDRVEMTIGGINHFHWVMGLNDMSTGADLLVRLHEQLDKGDLASIPPLADYMYRTFGLLPFPADSHIGEYVGFAYPITGPILLSPSSNGHDIWMEQLEKIAGGEAPVTEQIAGHTEEFAIPIISYVVFDSKVRVLSVNVPNEGGMIDNLPEDSIVEVPAIVDASGVRPVHVGPLPESIAAMCRLQISIQNLLVDAYGNRCKNTLLQALLLDPTVDNADRAEGMMNQMLERNAAYLPELE